MTGFVDDCLARLHLLHDAAGSAALLTPEVKASNLNRHYLCGHSGGGFPLRLAVSSNLTTQRPTDVCLFDCTYWDTDPHRDWIEKARKEGRLGNTGAKSRFIAVAIKNKVVQEDVLDPQSGKTTKVWKISQETNRTYDNLSRLTAQLKAKQVPFTELTYASSGAANTDTVKAAMRSASVLFIWVSTEFVVKHGKIPDHFLPMVIETAP